MIRRYNLWIESRLSGRVGEAFTAEYDDLEVRPGGKVATAQAVRRLLAPDFENRPVERFYSIPLDGRHRSIGVSMISQGTLNSSIVHPREVFGDALRVGAAAVIVAHNHPSGDPEPSREDLAVTHRLAEAGKLLGIPLLDHVILGSEGRLVSLWERGIIR